jgi:hypothetical protein
MDDKLFDHAENAQEKLFDSVIPPEKWSLANENLELSQDASNQILLAEYHQTDLDIVASVFMEPNVGEFQLQVFFDGVNQDVISCHVGESLSANIAKQLGGDVDTVDYSQNLHPIEERMLSINAENGI